MVAGATAVAAPCVLAIATLQGRAGFGAVDLFSLHQLSAGSKARTRRSHSERGLAAEAACACLLVPHSSCAGPASIHRASGAEERAGARSHARAGYFAVHGDTGL